MRDLFFGEEARQILQDGVNQVVNTVKTTLGPMGKNVLVTSPAKGVTITNSGASIINDIDLVDIGEDMGAQMIKKIAKSTNEAAGDGSTTTMLLAQAIITEGIRNITSGANPILLRNGMSKAANIVTEYLKSSAKQITSKEDIAHIAGISADDENIGEIIAEIIEKLGSDGVINIENSQTMQTTYEIVYGTRFDKGYLSHYMISDEEKAETILENPYILFTDKKISDLQEVLPILDAVAQTGKPILIIADDVVGEALKALIINKLKGTINVIAVRSPGFGDRKKALVDDIALICGATVISEELGYDLSRATIDMLGRAKKVIIKKDSTLIIDGDGNMQLINERIEMLHKMLDNAKDEFAVDRAKERLGKLVAGVGVIHVGAATELELKEKKRYVQNALNVTRSAFEEGIVAGGGVAYCNAVKEVKNYAEKLNGDEKVGAKIIADILPILAKQIVDNAGGDGKVVVSHITACADGTGLDVCTGEYKNMIDAGITDAVRVLRIALQNAVSMASTFLTTEINSVDPKDERWLYSGGKSRRLPKNKR